MIPLPSPADSPGPAHQDSLEPGAGLPATVPDPLAGRRVLVLISGSIAAVKLPLLVSALVKRGAEVRGHHEAVQYLWEVLGEFSPEEKALFCRFAWGRSRMPERCAGVKFIVELVPLRGQLPVAHTCFFQLDLPRYTSKEVLKEKLLSAIYYCKDMDLT